MQHCTFTVFNFLFISYNVFILIYYEAELQCCYFIFCT
jgi:hypothetical protein